MNRIIQTEEHNLILNHSIGFGSIKFVVSERRFLLIAAIFFLIFIGKKLYEESQSLTELSFFNLCQRLSFYEILVKLKLTSSKRIT